MIVALDTDVLVSWAMAGSVRHEVTRGFLERRIDQGDTPGLLPQCIFEFLHVVTDGRRFERPMTMEKAIGQIGELWDSTAVVRINPTEATLHRVLGFLSQQNLGRKRIFYTAVAASLEASSIRKLATFNGRDYEVFPFIEVVEPT